MTNDVRSKYPRAAAVVGGLAVLCLVLGAVQAPAFYLFGAWLGLVAVILACGPGGHAATELTLAKSTTADHYSAFQEPLTPPQFEPDYAPNRLDLVSDFRYGVSRD